MNDDTPRRDNTGSGESDGAIGNDKAMKQFSRTDAERDRAGLDAEAATEQPALPEEARATQPPLSTAPADVDADPAP